MAGWKCLFPTTDWLDRIYGQTERFGWRRGKNLVKCRTRRSRSCFHHDNEMRFSINSDDAQTYTESAHIHPISTFRTDGRRFLPILPYVFSLFGWMTVFDDWFPKQKGLGHSFFTWRCTTNLVTGEQAVTGWRRFAGHGSSTKHMLKGFCKC